MFEYLTGIFFSPFIIPVVAIVAAIGVPIVTSAWVEMEKHKNDSELKRCMIERGMSAAEIEQVLAAKTPDSKADKMCRGTDRTQAYAPRHEVA